ncbi:MAG: ureidoglycolate lyase [Pseudomonadota bacterium]
MSAIVLTPEPLTASEFAPFGSVLEEDRTEPLEINDARFDRFSNLAEIEIRGKDSFVNTSIMRCRTATELPLTIDTLERHPLGSQAFMPLQTEPLYIVVAPPGATPEGQRARAFVSNGRQGINYACGVWHLPLIATSVGQRFFVVDCGNDANCDVARVTPLILRKAESAT